MDAGSSGLVEVGQVPQLHLEVVEVPPHVTARSGLCRAQSVPLHPPLNRGRSDAKSASDLTGRHVALRSHVAKRPTAFAPFPITCSVCSKPVPSWPVT